MLRTKLAHRYSACILPLSCTTPCREHRHRWVRTCWQFVVNTTILLQTNALVFVCNTLFTLVAIWHLTYLGMVFDDTSDTADSGFTMHHTLDVWRRAHFSSHCVVVLTMIIAYFLWFVWKYASNTYSIWVCVEYVTTNMHLNTCSIFSSIDRGICAMA